MTGPDATVLTLSPAGRFHFRGTARAHGWVDLAPNTWVPATETVHRVLRLAPGRGVRLEISGRGRPPRQEVEVRVRHGTRLGDAEEEQIRAAVRRMFRLDEDLSEFYALCRDRGGPWARIPRGFGRLLRSPTFFEDVVKTICTTNIQWAGTRRMVAELVRAFGERPGDAPPTVDEETSDRPGEPPRSFPAPDALARVSREAFAERVTLGYRAPWIHGLARRVAEGELELEALADSDRPTPELRRELEGIRGVGSYGSATLLMLAGRYGHLAVDSVFRDFVAERHFGGARPSDGEARAVYEGWGEWRYLAYWFEMRQAAGADV